MKVVEMCVEVQEVAYQNSSKSLALAGICEPGYHTGGEAQTIAHHAHDEAQSEQRLVYSAQTSQLQSQK